MPWKKLKPIKPEMIACGNCSSIYQELPMCYEISVGFGVAIVTKDNETIYDENMCKDQTWTVRDAEIEAAKDPDHDYRIILYGPLRERVFQRQGDEKWVLVLENDGFA